MSRGRFVIGVTGGIATGKTTVLTEMHRLGLPTISADDLAHACLRRGHPCQRKVIAHFGPEIVESGQVNRRKLGAIVFANPAERKWLQKQIHPWVNRGILSFIRKHRGMIAVDIPLLYEAGYQRLFDAVVVVSSTRKAQMDRLRRRNGLDRQSAAQRIRAQWPLALKRKRADFILQNHQGVGKLRRDVRSLVRQFKAMGRKA